MTRNASEFLLKSVACREYTLPRDDPASEAKGWIQGTRELDLFWKLRRPFSTSSLVSKFVIPSVEGRQFSILGQNFFWNHSLCEQLRQAQHS